MSDILKAVQIQEIDLETKEHGFIPHILLRAGFKLVSEIQVSKCEIHQQRTQIMDHAKREVVDRLWQKLYGDIAREFPKLRHELLLKAGGSMADWHGITAALDEFSKLFKRPL